MEYLLYNIINRIAYKLPEMQTIDEDYGQLEALDNETDTYPLTFPAVLIDAPTTDWSNLSGRSQKGTVTVNVRLLIDCYDDTHYGSGTTDRILQRQELCKKLHETLQGFRPHGDGELIRIAGRFTTANHGIKVYESVYTVATTDIIPETTKVDGLKMHLSVSAVKL